MLAYKQGNILGITFRLTSLYVCIFLKRYFEWNGKTVSVLALCKQIPNGLASSSKIYWQYKTGGHLLSYHICRLLYSTYIIKCHSSEIQKSQSIEEYVHMLYAALQCIAYFLVITYYLIKMLS